MKFRVVIEDWARGGDSSNYLLNQNDGSRCCLGFVALRLGVGDGCLRNVANPFSMKGQDAAKCEGVLFSTSREGYKEHTRVTCQPITVVGSSDDGEQLWER